MSKSSRDKVAGKIAVIEARARLAEKLLRTSRGKEWMSHIDDWIGVIKDDIWSLDVAVSQERHRVKKTRRDGGTRDV